MEAKKDCDLRPKFRLEGCDDSTPVRGASYEPTALVESLQSQD
jgi:hypothetical protein